MKLVMQYSCFAVLAMLANLGAQELSLYLYVQLFSTEAGALPVAIIVGTGIGLAVKYLLDKRYIFRFVTRNAAHDGKTFMLYTLMGLLTTCIFWGSEYLFDYLFQDKLMRYCGAVLGLSVGYIVKYHLDKRFVFVS